MHTVLPRELKDIGGRNPTMSYMNQKLKENLTKPESDQMVVLLRVLLQLHSILGSKSKSDRILTRPIGDFQDFVSGNFITSGFTMPVKNLNRYYSFAVPSSTLQYLHSLNNDLWILMLERKVRGNSGGGS